MCESEACLASHLPAGPVGHLPVQNQTRPHHRRPAAAAGAEAPLGGAFRCSLVREGLAAGEESSWDQRLRAHKHVAFRARSVLVLRRHGLPEVTDGDSPAALKLEKERTRRRRQRLHRVQCPPFSPPPPGPPLGPPPPAALPPPVLPDSRPRSRSRSKGAARSVKRPSRHASPGARGRGGRPQGS